MPSTLRTGLEAAALTEAPRYSQRIRPKMRVGKRDDL
jgi:hypothetical protein